MRIILFLLRRALLPERGNLTTFALWISVLGVALGIAQLMLVLSVMSGFQGMLQKNYTRISSELVVIPAIDERRDPRVTEKLLELPQVKATSPFYFGQGMVLKGGVGGVTLEGIDFPSSKLVVPWEEIWVGQPLLEKQETMRNWIWIGSQLAKKLNIKLGDKVRVLIAEGSRKRIIPFNVTAITKFGIYDHDLRYARIDLSVLLQLFSREGFEPMHKLALNPGFDLMQTMEVVEHKMGDDFVVKSWRDINQNIFLAVQHQKLVLFIVLEIIVALAAINVVNLLLISTQNRRRDVAILRAMGMRFSQVVFFFVAKGSAIGMLGVGVGVAIGLGLCKVVEYFQPEILSEAIYNVTHLPLKVEPSEVALVGAVAFVLCVLFSVLPALKAAWQRPVQSLRYE
ncbi:MAG: ABC transporter permease [Bdellovibrionaceae bacterium]|nr:ABC transporter permease [Bdellovibrionales bacterium]MCB9254297.1 ABC transporter permease [Pseudobdellovibrionaceae bacterium]